MASPKKRFQCGGVVASVWENEQTGDDGTFTVEVVRFSRRYKNSEGKWRSSASFRKNDLPKLEVVCRKAYEFLNVREVAKETETASVAEGN